MFRLPSWIGRQAGPDATEATQTPSPPSVMPIKQFVKYDGEDGTTLKTKRKACELSPDGSLKKAKRIKVESTSVQHDPSTTHSTHGKPSAQVPIKGITPQNASIPQNMDVDEMLSIIENEINKEILLKHDELKRIRQELGKGQVVLEQLRRCHLIPFPVAQGNPESMLNIIDGVGPSIQQANGSKPKWASPFGVTESAYTRHYAKWLIPDSRFDGVEVSQQIAFLPNPNSLVLEGRQTRNSFQLDPAPGKSRRRNGSDQKLQALPSGYAPAKENAGPSILKRADGQWVKLVCIDCHRENFGSTQGFINHCRIAHRREFKSHEEAAVNSGHVVEVDQFGVPVGEEKLAVMATGLVHQMIGDAPVDWSAARDVIKRVNDAMKEFKEGNLKGVRKIPGEDEDGVAHKASEKITVGEDFKPSVDTPYLSKLLKARGANIDLGDKVKVAKEPVDYDSDIEDDIAAPAATVKSRPAPILPAMRPGSSRVIPAASAKGNTHTPTRGTSSMSISAKRQFAQPGSSTKAEQMPTPAPSQRNSIDEQDHISISSDELEYASSRDEDEDDEEGTFNGCDSSDACLSEHEVDGAGDDFEDLPEQTNTHGPSPTLSASDSAPNAPSLVSDSDDQSFTGHENQTESEDEAQSSEVEIEDHEEKAVGSKGLKVAHMKNRPSAQNLSPKPMGTAMGVGSMGTPVAMQRMGQSPAKDGPFTRPAAVPSSPAPMRRGLGIMAEVRNGGIPKSKKMKERKPMYRRKAQDENAWEA